MKQIKVTWAYDDWTNTYYTKKFDIVDSVPKHNEILFGDRVLNSWVCRVDCEQGNPEVENYEYFITQLIDEDSELYCIHVAVPKANIYTDYVEV